MNVLVWATNFGADLWSTTRFLAHEKGARVDVVLENPAVFRGQGIAKLRPLDVRLIKRRIHHGIVPPKRDYDLTLMDSRVPGRRTSRAAMMLWHGFGWKGPNDESEFRWLYAQLARTWGDPRESNPQFGWQCFGQWDFEHRTTISRLHPDNCYIVGAASHDDLRKPIDRERLQPFYPFDVVHRKTVLIAPTWHYGEIFAHWGSDADLLPKLIQHLQSRGANVILRLHDSFRFDRSYRTFLSKLERKLPGLLLKFKNHAPDNHLDLQVADALITNFSSIANLFYATKRPTIHVYPVRSADEQFMWRKYSVTGVVKRKVDSVRYIWKLPPEDNGGLLARSFDETLSMVDQALEDPTCCNSTAKAFLNRHMLNADGRSLERIYDVIQQIVRA